MNARTAAFDRATLFFLMILLGFTALRVWGLQMTPLDLHFDEAQYWSWSRSLEWGYFSKPPLIAWVIAATTSIFGDAEWAVRLGAPLSQSLTALFVFALGRSMYGAWAGFWAGLAWLTMPGVWLSSSIISTDAVLLPFWALALLALWRLSVTRAWSWALVLGVAIGFGVLAKYAMLYFVLCTFFAARSSAPLREGLGHWRGVVAGLIAIALVAPNLYWNFQNGFATISHTASNAHLTPNFINPDEWLEFTLSQAAVIGPLLFGALCWLVWRAVRRASGLSEEDRFLLSFIAPIILAVMVIAFLSRANANWAVTAYPAAIIWLAGCLTIGGRGRRFMAAALAVNIVLGGATAVAGLNPAFADWLPGGANALKRTRGWENTAGEIATRAIAQPGEAPFTAVMVDHRATYFELTYYWRQARLAGAPLPPLRMWVLHGDARNSAEALNPMRPEEGGRVLVVHATPEVLPTVAGDFTAFRTVEHLEIPLGGGITRKLDISVGEGFAPVPRDEAFEARLRGDDNEP